MKKKKNGKALVCKQTRKYPQMEYVGSYQYAEKLKYQCSVSFQEKSVKKQANKADLKNREVSLNRVHLWCQSKNDIPYLETSAKDSTNVEQAFELLIKTCITFKAPERDELTQNVHIRPKETDSGRRNQICSRC